MARIHRRNLNDPYNHDGVVTCLEPNILECEVKWALGNITMNKASGGDGIPAELLKILKMILLKYYAKYVNKFEKLSSGHRAGKSQFSFQSQRRKIQKEVQTTVLLSSFHMLGRLW